MFPQQISDCRGIPNLNKTAIKLDCWTSSASYQHRYIWIKQQSLTSEFLFVPVMALWFYFLKFFVPLQNFLLIQRVIISRAANVDLYSALMAIGVTPTVTRGTVYNGHFRGPVYITQVAECLQWSCHYLFLWLRSIPARIWTLNLLHARRTRRCHGIW